MREGARLGGQVVLPHICYYKKYRKVSEKPSLAPKTTRTYHLELTMFLDSM